MFDKVLYVQTLELSNLILWGVINAEMMNPGSVSPERQTGLADGGVDHGNITLPKDILKE